MKSVYTAQFYEDGLRSYGFYEFENMGQFFQCLRLFSKSERKVTVLIRRHDIEYPCDVCGGDSIKEVIKLVIEK